MRCDSPRRWALLTLVNVGLEHRIPEDPRGFAVDVVSGSPDAPALAAYRLARLDGYATGLGWIRFATARERIAYVDGLVRFLREPSHDESIPVQDGLL